MSGTMCTKCGGFIGEPGKAYGYAGKWCDCAFKGKASDFYPSAFPDMSFELIKKLEERIKYLEERVNQLEKCHKEEL